MRTDDTVFPLVSPDVVAAIRERAPRVAVIGDFLLDGWWSGDISRLAREAPAPVVELGERQYAPGGAANTAMNLAALGGRVAAVGLVGDDEAGRMLISLLRDASIDVEGLHAVAGTRTTTKFRILSSDQLMLRLDDSQRSAWPADALASFVRAADMAAARADAEVICDYGSGVMNEEVIAMLGARAARAALRVVDAHDPRRWSALAPDVVTPNAGEAERILGRRLLPEEDRPQAIVESAAEILGATGARAAVVTLDRDGSVLVQRDGRPHRTHAHPALERQSSGAGDTFVAALTLAAAAGLDWDASADLAQAAADVAVQKPGTCVCTSAELEASLGRAPDARLDLVDLLARLAQDRGEGRRIVFTNGCFDVLHRGHTAYLRQAKHLGDVLVVAINEDESVRRLKGPDRPINSAADRANVLAALSCVDYVAVFAEDTPSDLLRLIRPDVYAKGGDYTPEMLEETEVVRALGGEVAILDYVPEHSTTNIVNRIRSSRTAATARDSGA